MRVPKKFVRGVRNAVFGLGTVYSIRDDVQSSGSHVYHGLDRHSRFEGWYFKHTYRDGNTSQNKMFSFIVGYSTFQQDVHSFIQFTDGHLSHYFRFPLDSFSFNKAKMTISVGNNIFSHEGINANLSSEELNVKCGLKYENIIPFKKSLYCPTIMGPFSYFPMPCNHALISHSHNINGSIELNGQAENIDGLGYIEKDFGKSFPKNYAWLHAQNENISIMFALAYPLPLNMKGYLCSIYFKNKQHNLSLYSCAKIKSLKFDGQNFSLNIRKRNLSLTVNINTESEGKKLIAPDDNGQMSIPIKEALNATASVVFTQGKLSSIFTLPAAFEIVGDKSLLEI